VIRDDGGAFRFAFEVDKPLRSSTRGYQIRVRTGVPAYELAVVVFDGAIPGFQSQDIRRAGRLAFHSSACPRRRTVPRPRAAAGVRAHSAPGWRCSGGSTVEAGVLNVRAVTTAVGRPGGSGILVVEARLRGKGMATCRFRNGPFASRADIWVALTDGIVEIAVGEMMINAHVEKRRQRDRDQARVYRGASDPDIAMSGTHDHRPDAGRRAVACAGGGPFHPGELPAKEAG